MSRPSTNSNTSPSPTKPIPISTGAFSSNMHHRHRSASLSSSSSGSPDDIPTPVSSLPPNLRTPGSSPILSYFLGGNATSPNTKPLASFGGKALGNTPVFEEEEEERTLPVTAHARRASARLPIPTNTTSNPIPATSPPSERGAGLLRRLSLGSAAFTRPNPSTLADHSPPPPAPPPSAISSDQKAPFATLPARGSSAVADDDGKMPSSITRKPRRSATISGGLTAPSGNGNGRKRAPSPMGERILKGHFDGFN